MLQWYGEYDNKQIITPWQDRAILSNKYITLASLKAALIKYFLRFSARCFGRIWFTHPSKRLHMVTCHRCVKSFFFFCIWASTQIDCWPFTEEYFLQDDIAAQKVKLLSDPPPLYLRFCWIWAPKIISPSHQTPTRPSIDTSALQPFVLQPWYFRRSPSPSGVVCVWARAEMRRRKEVVVSLKAHLKVGERESHCGFLQELEAITMPVLNNCKNPLRLFVNLPTRFHLELTAFCLCLQPARARDQHALQLTFLGQHWFYRTQLKVASVEKIVASTAVTCVFIHHGCMCVLFIPFSCS